MKRFVLIGCFVFLLLIGSLFVSSIDSEGLEEGVENVQEKAEEVKAFTEKERWEFLSEKWQEYLLRNNFIQGVDKFFKTVDKSFIFVVLFGQRYSLSMTFFFSIIWFIFVFLVLSSIFKAFFTPSYRKINPAWSIIPHELHSLIALGAAIILAQLKFYIFLSTLTFKLIFYKEGPWSWVWTILFFVVYFFILFFARRVIVLLVNTINPEKKALEKGQKALDERLRDVEEYTKGIDKGLEE